MDQCDNRVCTRVLFAIKCQKYQLKLLRRKKNSFKQPSCNTQPKKSQIYASNDNEKIASCSQYQFMYADDVVMCVLLKITVYLYLATERLSLSHAGKFFYMRNSLDVHAEVILKPQFMNEGIF